MGFKLVAKGLGVALLPESICKLIGFDIDTSKMIPLIVLGNFMELAMVWRVVVSGLLKGLKKA
ncbi:hypothetical protein MKX29_23350 [Cytobacillus sp. FSL R7-0696]|uniref:hypothetical protein n=1 Tax=Cytobacillus sp. FSL R7-0696 TaxID=2921691 RepID=UPI0030F529FE